MPAPTLTDLLAAAASTSEPILVPARTPQLGGVDPLGLRQINFDLMDQVLPGLNNVARHVRPFVMVTWAWRRARQIAEKQDAKEVRVQALCDFIDRIEVIYAWSQLLLDPNADVPGRQALNPVVQAQEYHFGGSTWDSYRRKRRDSTAFTAAVNYGPGLRSLGWLERHAEHAEVMMPTPAVTKALDAFEVQIADRLEHAAFSSFGDVTVSRDEVQDWADAWSLNTPTKAEQETASELLFGSLASPSRRMGGKLMLAAVQHATTSDADQIRSTMSGAPSNFYPPDDLVEAAAKWRRMQVRQLFRLSLEGCFSWIQQQLQSGPKPTEALVEAFLREAEVNPAEQSADVWLRGAGFTELGPTGMMDRISAAMNKPQRTGLARAILDGISFSIAHAPENADGFDRQDRLPVFRVRQEAAAWKETSADEFTRHVLESWVLAQHVYWSVGRGLADARSRGRFILRLKVVMDEGGWTLAPGVSGVSSPHPTADRLATALSLAAECNLISVR